MLCSTISLTVFVDDFTIEASGRLAIQNVAKEIDHVITFFEQGFGMEISSTKSVVVASKPSTAAKVLCRMFSKKAKPAKQAKLLGTPSGGGRRRSVKVLKDRVLKFKAKIPRIHALRRLRVRTATIARAAGTPAVTYGVETCGMSDTHFDFGSRGCG